MRYAIGDIHGGKRTFQALLSRLPLRKGDRLYLLGDYIDRGPDSRGVLDIIISLMNAGYDVRPLMGNHEDMLLRTISGDHDAWSRNWQEMFGNETLCSFDVSSPAEIPPHYLNLLGSLKLVATENDFVLVHAGLNFTVADPLKESTPFQCLWFESGCAQKEKLGGRALLTGHTVRTISQIRGSLRSPRICLDNGAFTNRLPDYGNLVALNLDRQELICQPWIDN